MIQKSPLKYFLFAFALIVFDQTIKMAVHFYMSPGFAGQIKLIGDWFKLHYVLNPGMAFGMQLSHTYGKLILSVFRLVAMIGIGWYLVHLARRGAPNGLLWAMAMILAGAVGNVIDSTFYGVLLNNAPYDAPTPWFHGQVIDMIFIDVWEGFIPDWVPVWGGQYYSTPIFNIADSCIFVGVCFILFFQRRYFGEHIPEGDQLPNDEFPDANENAVVPASLLESDVEPIHATDEIGSSHLQASSENEHTAIETASVPVDEAPLSSFDEVDETKQNDETK